MFIPHRSPPRPSRRAIPQQFSYKVGVLADILKPSGQGIPYPVEIGTKPYMVKTRDLYYVINVISYGI